MSHAWSSDVVVEVSIPSYSNHLSLCRVGAQSRFRRRRRRRRRRRLRSIRRRAGWIDARSTRLIVDALVRDVRMYGGKMALRSVDCGGGGRGRRPRRRHATDEKKRTDVQSSTRAQFSRRLAAPAPSLPARDMASSVKYFLLPTYGGTFESTFILFYLIRLHEPYWLARGLRPRRRGRRTTR